MELDTKRKPLVRTDIINLLINRHAYRNYLEIGIRKGKNFDAVNCKWKVGIDPDMSFYKTPMTDNSFLFQTTSNEFFSKNTRLFDIVFVDGLHEFNQVVFDIKHALFYLKDGGTVVVHDTNPKEEIHQRIPRESKIWNGDVWKAIAYLRYHNAINLYTVDTDYGVTVIQKHGSPLPRIS